MQALLNVQRVDVNIMANTAQKCLFEFVKKSCINIFILKSTVSMSDLNNFLFAVAEFRVLRAFFKNDLCKALQGFFRLLIGQNSGLTNNLIHVEI